jgi:hypothetical protein
VCSSDLYTTILGLGGESIVTVAGVPQTVAVNFTELGLLSVNATGLPSGTSWTFVIDNGASYSGGGSLEITPSVPDGSHSFLVAATGYVANPAAGNFTVTGSATTYLTISFTPVTSQSPNPGSTLLGSNFIYGYVLIGVLAAAAVALLIGMIYYQRRTRSRPPPPPAPVFRASAPPRVYDEDIP